jgi:uncharacterized membrane protein YcaP (DUF421 family)
MVEAIILESNGQFSILTKSNHLQKDALSKLI